MRGQKRRFARLEMLSGLLVCVLLVCAIPHSASAQAVSLSQARKTVSAAKTPEALLAALRSSLSGMQPRDAITLAEEFETKVPSTSRAEIRFLISGLHQLLGQPGQAAQWARKAAELDRRYLMQAFRFAMASGDLEAAEGIIGQMGPNDTQRLLAEAWIMLMDGNYANIISMPVPSSGTVEQPVRRELLFLAFLADIGVKGSALQSVSLLVRDFPHSPEAGLAQGSVVASAEFILQSGLVIGSSLRSLAAGRVLSSKSQDIKIAPGANEERWLQTGYFSSRENAERFSKTLVSRGFRTRVVETRNSSGEPRWAVHVAGGENWQKTQSALKDQGFESYLVP